MTSTRKSTVVAALSVATLLTALAPTAMAAEPLRPQIIGGVPDASTAAAVAIDIGGEYSCTGSLWRSRILVTAAHCLQRDDGSFFPAEAISMWAPGASTAGAPSSVKVTDVVVDTDWTSGESDYEVAGRDLAFLILDAPLGTPYWSRLATPMEAATLTWNFAPAQFAGYGITTPTVDPRAELATNPTSLTTDYLPSYESGVESFEVEGNGTIGTCGGDSGGPWMATVAGQRVLVGPLSGGQGTPCGRPEDPDETLDYGAVASSNTDLTSVALRLAGEQPDAVPTTCVKGPDVKRACWSGRAWEYSYCWAVKKAELWKWFGNDDWRRVDRFTGWKDTEACGTKNPYVITFRRITAKDNEVFSVRIPRQPGNDEAMWDDFRVLVS